MKLCSDIYVLTSILDGASFDEMKDLISSGKTSTQNDSVSVEHGTLKSAGSNDVELSLIRSLISSLQADILSLKQTNDNLREEIESVKSEIKTVKTDLADTVVESNNSLIEIQHLAERVTDDRANGVSSVKSGIRQIRTDVRSLNEYVDIQYSKIKERLAAVQKIEKRISKIENTLKSPQRSSASLLSHNNGHNAALPDPVILVTSGSETEKLPAQLPTDGTHTASANCSKAIDIETVPVNNTLLYRSPTTGRFHRRPNALNQHMTASDSSGIQNECMKTQGGVGPSIENRKLDSTGHTTNAFMPHKDQSSGQQRNDYSLGYGVSEEGPNSRNEHETMVEERVRNDEHVTPYHCQLKKRYNALGENMDTKGSLSYSAVLQTDQSRTTAEQNRTTTIPVLISNKRKEQTVDSRRPRVARADNFGDNDDNDDEFETHIRRRSHRFYVGGFKASVTEKKIMNYMARRGISVTWISIRRYEHQNRAVIRLNVDAREGSQLLDEGFWPDGITCRRWYSKAQYQNKVQKFHNRESKTTLNSYDRNGAPYTY